jgi:hypothetical protein
MSPRGGGMLPVVGLNRPEPIGDPPDGLSGAQPRRGRELGVGDQSALRAGELTPRADIGELTGSQCAVLASARRPTIGQLAIERYRCRSTRSRRRSAGRESHRPVEGTVRLRLGFGGSFISIDRPGCRS